METDILLNNKKSIGARNVNNNLPINVESTFKPLVMKDLKEVVDLYDVYRKEYSDCTKYRVTLTIKPYCTNILFNVCTEVIKDECGEECVPVYDNDNVSIENSAHVYGKRTVRRYYMVSNTEYSSPESSLNFNYYPGYDIFNNHILRNLSFRPIIFPHNIERTRERFNTLIDYMRTKDGKDIEIYPRFSYEDIEDVKKIKAHVYYHGNLLGFFDGSSIDSNLYVDNGWYGFKNVSNISDKEMEGTDYEGHRFSNTINNAENCQFIDMFPDRTRYSFVPKYNPLRRRYEKNWDIFLTYPWKNFYNHNLVCNVKTLNNWTAADKKTFALTTLRVRRTNVATNRRTMLFRTFCKHNLLVNDKIAVYLSKNNGRTYTKLPREYTVDYLGDEDGNNRDYFFGIASKTMVNDIFAGEIEDLFYQDYEPRDGGVIMVTVSEGISEVPDSYNRTEIIQVFKYEQVEEPQQSYSEDETFDSMPKTINSYSSVYIRVWDGTYGYWRWDDESAEYSISEMNPQIEYGDWNTYTDVPTQQTVRYIRIKNYLFYIKRAHKYRMKNTASDIDGVINEQFEQNGWHIRFCKVVSNVECKYYIRQFRKVPNLKNSSEPLPNGVSENENCYLNFIKENASDENGDMLPFDSETYKLAFSKTLYGDDVAQVTFLDTMDIENLTDNLGRPVTEIYSTVVKRNKGYKEWYDFTQTGEETYEEVIRSDKIEYSRCFGSLTTGFEYLDLPTVFDERSDTRYLKGKMSSVGSIYRDNNKLEEELPWTVEDWDGNNIEKEITETDDVFFGDVVEYNPIRCQETVLSDACFRFNTAQREVGRENSDEEYNFIFHELTYDDFDPADGRKVPFRLTEYQQWGLDENENEEIYKIISDSEHKVTIRRPEGYFYKPHTKIQLLKYSDNVTQGSHRTLRIKNCVPIQNDAIFIKVNTRTIHNVNSDSVIYICYGSEWIETKVVDIIDRYNFTIAPISKNVSERDGASYVDWVTICKGVVSGSIKLRVKNEEIPSYADKVDENTYLWREIINPVNLSDKDNLKHPFANNCFYVDSQVNVYLKRQDPESINGLYYSGNLADIMGQMYTSDNNEFKSESEILC